ncbi:MAG TPA: glycosyltransferase family A protein [Bacteroidota bacterium]|nr:glycosyltransferase family A protein [Bacteroidota bacterium]
MTTPYKETQNHEVVSIVLCTFNRARLVRRAIESVFAQTYPHWELLIIDDGSTDHSEEKLLPLAKRDRRVMYVRQANKGLAGARNTGIALASGTYVTFLDSDDEYRSNHLQKRVAFMRSHPRVDVLHGGIAPAGPRSKHYVVDLTSPGRKIHVGKCLASGTIFARRSVLKRVGGFRDVNFGEDFDLMKRLQKKYAVKRVPWATYVYHTETSNRLCDLYEDGGEAAIVRFRKRGSSSRS